MDLEKKLGELQKSVVDLRSNNRLRRFTVKASTTKKLINISHLVMNDKELSPPVSTKGVTMPVPPLSTKAIAIKKCSSQDVSGFVIPTIDERKISPLRKRNSVVYNNESSRIHDKTSEKTQISPRSGLGLKSPPNDNRHSLLLMTDFFKQFQELYSKNNQGQQPPNELANLVETYKAKLTGPSSVVNHNSQLISHNFGTTKTLPLDCISEENFSKTIKYGNESMDHFISNNIGLENQSNKHTRYNTALIGESKQTKQFKLSKDHENKMRKLDLKFCDNYKGGSDEVSSRREFSERTERDVEEKHKEREESKTKVLRGLEEKTDRIFDKYAHLKKSINPDFYKHNISNFKNKFKNFKTISTATEAGSGRSKTSFPQTASPVKTYKNEFSSSSIMTRENDKTN